MRVHSLISWGESQVQVRRALKPEPSQKPVVESAEVWEHREGDDVPMTGDPKS